MSRKIFLILVMVLALAACTACSAEEAKEKEAGKDYEIEANEEAVETEEADTEAEEDPLGENPATDEYEFEDMCLHYEEGLWDGKFVYNHGHCASVEDGILWIDNKSTGHPIDMGTTEQSVFCEVVGKSADGTYIAEDGRLQLWSKGEMLLDYEHPVPHYGTTSYQLSDSVFVFRYGQHMIWWKNGEAKTISDEVIDTELCDSGDKVRYTTFAHEVYEVNVDGETTKTGENTVRFQDDNFVSLQLAKSEDRELAQKFFEDWKNKGWNNFTYIDFEEELDAIARIDDYGNLYINNKLVANYNLGCNWKFTVAEDTASNIFYTEDFVYYATGKEVNCYYKGEILFSNDVADGSAKILAESGPNHMALEIANEDGTTTIQVVTPAKIVTISEEAVDAHVAYDTLYWMDRKHDVYSCHWYEDEIESQLFFENAIAVSPYSDESQGAIVEKKFKNWGGYGYENIYSPYGW